MQVRQEYGPFLRDGLPIRSSLRRGKNTSNMTCGPYPDSMVLLMAIQSSGFRDQGFRLFKSVSRNI